MNRAQKLPPRPRLTLNRVIQKQHQLLSDPELIIKKSDVLKEITGAGLFGSDDIEKCALITMLYDEGKVTGVIGYSNDRLGGYCFNITINPTNE